uniref:Uncharacterized protein n=1 Tax=Romanomermis culicivorax TaxID=13658 RepID=A0A915HJQ3_ROMCU
MPKNLNTSYFLGLSSDQMDEIKNCYVQSEPTAPAPLSGQNPYHINDLDLQAGLILASYENVISGTNMGSWYTGVGPVVVLNRQSAQENPVILYSNHLLPNYSLVKLDDSTLIITNLVSNMAKGLIIRHRSVPLFSIIIKNFKEKRMRSLTLKFEHQMVLNISQLAKSEMLTFYEFERKLFAIDESIDKEGFSLEHDTRFDAPPIDKESMNKPKSKSKVKTGK